MRRLLLLCLVLILSGCGCTTTYRVHVLDGAEQELRDAIVRRDTEIVDLQQVGTKLVADYGRSVAWKAVLGVWDELTGGSPLEHAGDVIWLQDRGAHTQCVAWLIHFRRDWL